MEVKVEDLPQGKIKLTVTVPSKAMAGYFSKSYEKLASSVKISGFRPGKAPRKIVESEIGIGKILSEALDLAINNSYFEALQKENISPISSPTISISQYPDYSEEVEKDMIFEAELEIMPEVKIGDLSKIKIEKKPAEKPKKEDVEKVLSYFRKQKANFIDIDRPAKKGDQVEINFEGYLKGVKIDQMSSKHHPIILGEGSLIPGFEEQIEGLKKDDKKDFQITFPKDYHSKNFAGKEAKFAIEVLDIKEVKLPEVDDKFAEGFGHANVEELKKAVEENLQKEMDHQNEHEIENQIIEAVLPKVSAQIPEAMVLKETDRMIEEMKSQVGSQGLSFELYLQSIKKSLEDLKVDFKPRAERNVKIGLLLSKIIDDHSWDRSDPKSGKQAIDYLIETLTKSKK